MEITSNITSTLSNNTSNLAFLSAFSGVLNTLSFFIVAVEIASIYVLQKCVLVTDQIKTISQNLLLADISFHVMQIFVAVVNAIFQMSSTSVLNARLRMGCLYVLVLIYCMLMIVAALDRFIAIRHPLHYEMLFPLSTVKKIVRVIWFVTIFVVLIPFILGISLYCTFASCDNTGKPLLFNQYFRMVLAVLFIICDICVATLYAFIIFKSGDQLSKLRRIYNGAQINMRLPGRRIMLIVGTFIVLYSPSVIYTLLFDLLQIEASFAVLGVFYVTGFRICTSVHSCISLYFYTYGIPECRMRFTAIFLSWSKKYRQQSNQMKILLFNIPIVERVTVKGRKEKILIVNDGENIADYHSKCRKKYGKGGNNKISVL